LPLLQLEDDLGDKSVGFALLHASALASCLPATLACCAKDCCHLFGRCPSPDLQVFEFQKLSEAEQEERVAAIRRQQADQSFPE